MKNILTVFAFIATMFMGVQTSSAQQLSQDKSRPEVIAKTESAKLTETLGLSGDQGRAVFRALVAKEVGYQKNVDGKDAKSAPVAAEKKKLDDQLKDAMKKTLTDQQYAKWLKTNN
ncbi:hypothetical protein Aeqsu_1686 [Aequorivita sublithincola DSM 14238]|uniref:Peptidylprolyl isomerase n=1 Tax=Aequorivita sublithincola (strain DSM 14238 / LMG 21431 / ACAM 643 / 9-3) TaxID=746697 RepID=I3YVZ9_AEQSU|nr:hypothetical protein [Aequorivita sublithincola]AFL81167.1 hypothetical protein Aeqsu_1686 [Aequorivita sublithincola DSM 14238]